MRRLVRLALAAVLVIAVPVGHAEADREHRVRSGQTLSGIARRYGVTPSAIARANGLRENSTLRIGQVLLVPSGETASAEANETVTAFARRHGLDPQAVARLNGLRPTSRLRRGQRLTLPDPASTAASDAGWGRPRQPGVVTMKRLGSRESYRGRLTDPRGRPRPDAMRRLTRLLRDDDGAQHAPNPRLLRVLTQISDHFGGRVVHVVSGYRRPGGYTRDSSRHTRGDAVDIRVEGVPITAIRDYCRSLTNTGCGYYPNSRFVHVDVRDRATYWVDWSGPGEAPRYRRPDGASEPDGDGTDADSEAAGEAEAGEGSRPAPPDEAPAADATPPG